MADEGMSEDLALEESSNVSTSVGKKEKKAGIIYLSSIPTGMNVFDVRRSLSQYGDVGRIFLEPVKDEVAKIVPGQAPQKGKKKKEAKWKRFQPMAFKEGWVEFTDKKVAKMVVAKLNAHEVGGKRKNPWYDDMWNMRYLPKFQWGHLNERQAYEKAAKKQRMRTEVAQAKKETNFIINNIQKSATVNRLKEKGKFIEKEGYRTRNFKQRMTDEEIQAKRRKMEDEDDGEEEDHPRKKRRDDPNKQLSINKSFLQSIFSGGIKS